jgi:hypothetical protein
MARSVELLDVLSEVVLSETGIRPVIDNPDWTECDTQDAACEALVRSRTRTDELILVRAFAGLTKIRVELVRLRTAEASLSTSGDLPLESADWPSAILPLVRPLFPDPLDPLLLRAREPNVLSADPANKATTPDRSPGPWIIMGASAVAAGFGVGFFASSQDARSELVSGRLFTSEEFDALNGRLESHSILAGVLLGTAVTGVVAGLAWLIWE